MTRLCACRCGQPTKLAPKTDRRRGWVKGEPMKFINGHQHKAVVRALEPPNPSGLCMCDCGEQTPIADRTHVAGRSYKIAGEHMRYVPGHQGRASAKRRRLRPAQVWIAMRGREIVGVFSNETAARTRAGNGGDVERHAVLST